MVSSNVNIVPVTSRREVKDYVMFPFRLYRNDPNWVPPLISDRMTHFDTDKNPFFEHAEMRMFRAVRDGQTVGTITAVADELHPKIWDEPVGFFGEFECIEDQSVANALLNAARRWLASRGRKTMRGPLNLNVNDEVGLLIDGFDGPPVIMMTYNFPYYQELLENYGLQKAKDLFAYYIDLTSFGPDLEGLPGQISRVARIARERYHVRMRHVEIARLEKEIELIKPVYRQAWQKNWSAVPITDKEMQHLARDLARIADERLTYLAFVDDQPVGVFVALPDFCQVAMHLGGRLFPVGWIKYLWYRRKVTGLRVLIMGVLEEHRVKGIEALFYEEGFREAINAGYQWVELSWILEDNFKVRRGIEALGGYVYRTYRIYDHPTA